MENSRSRGPTAPSRRRKPKPYINSLATDAIVAGAATELDATDVTDNVEHFRTLDVPTETYE
ncbi:hypothetical protein [Salinigranum marinum]|uniref:hypothetical protein n=1 Tax=Salinigranum marinum TaxID=1515595 RepID=UPI002989C1E0|nr:hypothetical protein [Salinigranum marinum]